MLLAVPLRMCAYMFICVYVCNFQLPADKRKGEPAFSSGRLMRQYESMIVYTSYGVAVEAAAIPYSAWETETRKPFDSLRWNRGLHGNVGFSLLPLPAQVAGAMPVRRSQVEAAGPDVTGAIHIKAWDPDRPYMTKLKSAGGSHCATTCDDCDRRTCVSAAYEMYRTLRDPYASSPAFFLDVATWFYGEAGGTAFGRRVLSSILELDLDDPSLLRIVAYRLTQAGDLDLAISILEDVLHMRPEEPQSHRDLALALARRSEGQGRRGMADLERAMALLHKVLMTEWRQRIHEIALTELNRLWARADALDATSVTKISRPALHPHLIANLTVDLRVALSWDVDDTDIDLWVLEPSGEKAYYQHPRTNLGGRLSRDITDG